MIINLIRPQGYCYGVINALKIVDDTLKSDCIKPIYILGMIIHNKNIIKKYESQGIITLHGNSRLEMVDKIDKGTVIITAHGASNEVFKKCYDKGLNVIDATCKNVNSVKDEIIKKIENNYKIIYIGINKHPETEGILSTDRKNIYLVEKIEDIDNLDIESNYKKIYLTNQTTLSRYDINDFISKLTNKYPNLEIDNKICNATLERQKAVMEMEEADLCIVIGDKLSSNTKNLYNIASKKMNTLLIEDEFDIDKDYFKMNSIKKINITSGASTPKFIVDKVIDKIKDL